MGLRKKTDRENQLDAIVNNFSGRTLFSFASFCLRGLSLRETIGGVIDGEPLISNTHVLKKVEISALRNIRPEALSCTQKMIMGECL